MLPRDYNKSSACESSCELVTASESEMKHFFFYSCKSILYIFVNVPSCRIMISCWMRAPRVREESVRHLKVSLNGVIKNMKNLWNFLVDKFLLLNFSAHIWICLWFYVYYYGVKWWRKLFTSYERERGKKSFLAARFYVWKTSFFLLCFEYKGLFGDGNNFFYSFWGISDRNFTNMRILWE